MAFDITNAIIDRFAEENDGLLSVVNAGLLTDDPTYLKTISRGPLQDDPTRRAFYICIEPESDPDKPDDFYRMPVSSVRRGKLGVGSELPQIEVGGGLKFINFFTLDGWTPKANTRELSYEQGCKALARLEIALFKMQRTDFYYGISTEDGRETTGDMVQIFGYDGGKSTPLGGDREWYSRIRMRFHMFSELSNRFF